MSVFRSLNASGLESGEFPLDASPPPIGQGTRWMFGSPVKIAAVYNWKTHKVDAKLSGTLYTLCVAGGFPDDARSTAFEVNAAWDLSAVRVPATGDGPDFTAGGAEVTPADSYSITVEPGLYWFALPDPGAPGGIAYSHRAVTCNLRLIFSMSTYTKAIIDAIPAESGSIIPHTSVWLELLVTLEGEYHFPGGDYTLVAGDGSTIAAFIAGPRSWSTEWRTLTTDATADTTPFATPAALGALDGTTLSLRRLGSPITGESRIAVTEWHLGASHYHAPRAAI